MTIDIATNALMQSIESPAITYLSKIVGKIFDPAVLIIISIIIAAYLYLRKSKKKGLILAITSLATGIVIIIFKEIFQRSRPLNGLISDTGFSLPSGHATIAVVFFGLIAYLFSKKKYKVATITITTLIILLSGFTRIYLRAHWLTDVLSGFVIGIIILTISILALRKTH
jgi:membrane-associated phospholipid phosphatase